MSEFAIRSIGIELGERELSVAELASAHGVSEAYVEASLGGMVVRATSRGRLELASAAVTRCLSKVGVSIDEVDLLIVSHSRAVDSVEPPLECLLGRPTLSPLIILGGCPVFFRAIWTARALLRTDGLRRAVIVYSENCAGGRRTLGPISYAVPRDILSDGAAAVLIEEGAGLALRGYGNVATAEHWTHFDPNYAHQGQGSQELQIARDSMEASKQALKLSLDTAGFSLDAVDAFVMPNELDALTRFIARHMHFPPDRVVRIAHAPSHVWAVDPMHNLEHLVAQGLAPGARIVCMTRGVAAAGALALEVVV